MYLLELINEILDLALIESGKLSLSLEPMSLSDVLLDCQAMIEPQAQKSGIHMSFHSLKFLTLLKPIDPGEAGAHQPASNAIKYNRAGGSVDVTCSANNTKRIRISVRIPAKACPGKARTTVPAVQSSRTRVRRRGRHRHRLVVSKRLVELMGGEIGAVSTVGAGRCSGSN